MFGRIKARNFCRSSWSKK